MKKLYLILLFVVVAISGMAQTIGDAFYIYRNDGQFNAFFRDEVDSIAYSNYDADSVYYDEIVTQLVYTQDSVYWIPLASVDSVGFVTPKTIYRDGTVQLDGELFDYLISADSLLLTFSPSMPANLIPKTDDKIVTTELSDKLPNGFLGRVKLVDNNDQGIDVYCDSLIFEEVVSQYYGVFEVASQDETSVRCFQKRKAPVETFNNPLHFNIPKINIPVSLKGIFTPKDAFGIGGNASWTIGIKPIVTGRVVRVVDDRTHTSYINLHAIADVNTSHTIEIAGVLKKDHDNFEALKRLWFHKDIPTPWGIPVYVAFGPLVEATGELAIGTTIYADFRYTVDVTFYPATIPYYLMSMNPIVRAIFQNAVASVNTIDHDVQTTRVDADWGYFAARGGIKVGGAARVGLAIGNHEVAWLGGEGQIGLRADAEINVDFDGIANAENSTEFYDALKNSSLTIMPYWGIQFVISGLDDHIQLKVGHDDYTLWGKKWEYGFLPKFSDAKAIMGANSTIADVSSDITNDCLIPYTIGFSLFDEYGKRIGEPQWNEQKFWTRKGFQLPLKHTFTDLATDKKYKVYPTIRLLGFNVLATPSADLDMHFPVTLSDFTITKSQYKKGAFTNEGRYYDYRFDAMVTATLDDDAENIADWGYVYLDPNGHEAFISLRQFGNSYTDDRWAYFRNEKKSTCTLYGYVKYQGSDEPVLGEPHDYPLEYGLTSCPDANHPHWIDLGLPSGTLWRCCNEGASTPEAFGGYYTFEQVSSAPSLEQIKELLNNCTYQWTTQNGVNGGKFTGPNGGTIFLPAAGGRWVGEFYDVGYWGDYWSSSPGGEYGAYELYFNSGNANWDDFCGLDWSRSGELSVRPVR